MDFHLFSELPNKIRGAESENLVCSSWITYINNIIYKFFVKEGEPHSLLALKLLVNRMTSLIRE